MPEKTYHIINNDNRRLSFLFCFLIVTIIFSFLPSSDLKSQSNQILFYDTLTKISNDGYVHSGFGDGKNIYISGGSFSQRNTLPTLTKIDTSGNTLWTAFDNDNYERFAQYSYSGNDHATCRGTIKSGDKLFTIAQYYNSVNAYPQTNEIWSVSDSTGILQWKLNLEKSSINKIVDYNATDLLAITTTQTSPSASDLLFTYYIIDKSTGLINYTKNFSQTSNLSNYSPPNILLDNNKNIILFWSDTCKKFRDNRLTQLLWTSHLPYSGRYWKINAVIQDSSNYLFLGINYVRSVDSLNGNTNWLKQIPVGLVLGSQSGGDCSPKDYILKDSLLFIMWSSLYTGGVDLRKGFAVSKINKYNGSIGFNTAHDFSGIPADPTPPINSSEELDWPIKMTMDENSNLYLIGSYDRGLGEHTPSNWGIMKVSGQNGTKIYESTITDDSTRRFQTSQGRFLYYNNGKMYCAGNLGKRESQIYSKPIFLSFDTTNIFTQRLRAPISSRIRYSSSLISITPFNTSKFVLLKKIGRSTAIEMRDLDNQLLWSKVFNTINKFIVPQNLTNLSDSGLAASFISYFEDTTTKVLMSKPDSLIFVRLDSNGTIVFTHKIKYNLNDTLSAVQLYKDNNGKINFVYRKKNGSLYNFSAYTLGGISPNLSPVSGGNELYDSDTVTLRLNPFQHYNVDSMIFYQTGTISSSRGWLYSSNQSSSGFQSYGSRIIRSFSKIYSTLKLDSSSFFVMGRDSAGQIRGSLYNHRLTNPLVWSYNSGVLGTMYNADTSASSLYTISRLSVNKNYTIKKLNRQTGAINWSFEKTAPLRISILPTDFKYNPFKKHFLVGGYIMDSSISGIKNNYFYLVLDSLGSVVKDTTGVGFGLKGTKINCLNILQNGSNIFGGSINTSSFGIAGFYNYDCFLNNLIPSVSINTASTNFCLGEPVAFMANAINQGSSPSYQWQVNGVNVGTSISTFTTTSLTNGAQVKVIMTSNAACLSTPTATSNTITMTVSSSVTPTVSIATGSPITCAGASVTFTATPINGGANPSYLWQVNGVNSGSNSNIFTAISLTNGAQVKVTMTSSSSCASPVTATSNTITMSVGNNNIIPVVVISGNTNLNLGQSTILNATPTNGGTNPAFQWKDSTATHNWQNISGAIVPTLIYSPLKTGDRVKCEMISNANCLSSNNATSNILVFTVTDTTTGGRGVVNYYPNPVNSILYLDRLSLLDKWETAEVISIDGRRVIQPVNISNRTRVELNVASISTGQHIVILTNIDGVRKYLYFIKI